MSVPVQTWGSMATMAAEQKDFANETAQYLERNEVYDLFAQLLRQVILHRPEQPLKFLQDQLKGKPKLCVCIMGPPGINRSKYCQRIATDYKIKHIYTGKLLRARKELKEIIEAGDLVPDEIVIDLVKAELTKARGTGWVLDGFPRTKVQAQALASKDLGVCVDHTLLLYTGEAAIRARFAAKVAAAGFSVAEKEELINRRLQQYHRHVVGIAELYKNCLRQLEVSAGDDDQNVTYNLIRNNLLVRPYSNAPLRMHRVCVLGPCASGRTTQCRAVARTFGVVHVDLAALLRKQQQASGKVVEEVPPEFVDDEELCALVGRRLAEADCIRKGFVLDGFPRTAAQAEFLRQSHMRPTRMIQLKLHVETVLSRITSRRIDPETGSAYYRNPANVTVRQRLVQAAHDQPEQVEQRFVLFADHVDKVISTFPSVSSIVTADLDITEVTKLIEEKITRPLPEELAQDPEETDN